MPFKKGKSGNPAGQTKDVAKIRQQLKREFAFISPQAKKVLEQLLLNDDPNMQYKAAKEILDRGIGKATETIELSGIDGEPIKSELIDRARGETPQEWLKRTRG